ncbi:MAG: hypothetical protein PHI36_01720 [Bacteroidales bacterium]|nr:hypothetical protein [Bacteroidales bacterium]
MKWIKYFDRINHQLLDLEVSDEVARVLWSTDRQWSRKGQKDRECIALSLDEQTEYNGEDALTYHELIEDEKANIEKNYLRKEFYELIWSIVDKLEEKQKKILTWYFKDGYRMREIASKTKSTTPALTQFKNTALKHLKFLLCNDRYFRDTNFYQYQLSRPFTKTVIKTAEKMKTQSFEINFDEVTEYLNKMQQSLKISDKIGAPIQQEKRDTLQEIITKAKRFMKRHQDEKYIFDYGSVKQKQG